MAERDLNIFNKGKFSKIDNEFISEGILALRELQKVQERFGKNDTDTFINELRDQIVGHTLGFNLVNVEKHGFDCKMADKKEVFLEVKAASYDSSIWNATFNDTTLEKAECFKRKNLYLALAIWKDASDLLFICFGQNEEIGKWLEEKVKWFKGGNTVRSTQSISFSKLINEYEFKICTVDRSTEDVKELIIKKYKKFKSIPNELFVNKYDVENYIK